MGVGGDMEMMGEFGRKQYYISLYKKYLKSEGDAPWIRISIF